MLLSEELVRRGFIKQHTADLGLIFDQEKRVVYHGIDPTADSAHAGNFVVWMLLYHLVRSGHKVVFLVGGGTGLIGDPKPDVERTLIEPDEAKKRVVKIEAQAKRLLCESVVFVNNYDWLVGIKLIDFLRDIGKHFTVNELIKKDAIAKRLKDEAGISYTEFAYPLLQAYDFLNLYRTHGCTLQVGGSDQWGNIVSGVDLIRRLEKTEVQAVTVPLIIDKTTGKKFGKSEGNAVWLDPEKTSPYAFYQFWLNTADENVIDYLKLFTTLPLEQIAELEKNIEVSPEKRQAQRVLAEAVTEFVHGQEARKAVEQVSELVFETALTRPLSVAELDLVRSHLNHERVLDGANLVEVLVLVGLAESKRQAREFIMAGAVTVAGQKVVAAGYCLESAALGDFVLLRRGKRQVAAVELSQ